jgi:hypothetical protein
MTDERKTQQHAKIIATERHSPTVNRWAGSDKDLIADKQDLIADSDKT